MQVFKTKIFARFAKREHLSDSALIEAVERSERGIIDADLGGCIIKQRVGRAGQGKSKGYRVLIAVRLKKRYIFMDGFAKNEKDNINDGELEALKKYGSIFINADDKSIKLSIKEGILQEVKYEKKT